MVRRYHRWVSGIHHYGTVAYVSGNNRAAAVMSVITLITIFFTFTCIFLSIKPINSLKSKILNFRPEFFISSCTKILTKIHPNYRWISGKTDMEFQFSSWNWQGHGILAKIQVGLQKDSMWIYRIPAGHFQAHGIFLRIFPHGMFPNSI